MHLHATTRTHVHRVHTSLPPAFGGACSIHKYLWVFDGVQELGEDPPEAVSRRHRHRWLVVAAELLQEGHDAVRVLYLRQHAVLYLVFVQQATDKRERRGVLGRWCIGRWSKLQSIYRVNFFIVSAKDVLSRHSASQLARQMRQRGGNEHGQTDAAPVLQQTYNKYKIHGRRVPPIAVPTIVYL